MVEEFAWPSEELVPFSSIKDASGGRVVDSRHVPAMGDDGYTFSWKKLEDEAAGVASARELTRLFAVKLRTCLFVGAGVKKGAAYDALGTGTMPGQMDTYTVGWNEVNTVL